MSPEQLMQLAKRAGDAAARAVFKAKPGQVEVHLSEAMLAGLCALAAELALKEAVLSPEEQAKLPKVLADYKYQLCGQVITDGQPCGCGARY